MALLDTDPVSLWPTQFNDLEARVDALEAGGGGVDFATYTSGQAAQDFVAADHETRITALEAPRLERRSFTIFDRGSGENARSLTAVAPNQNGDGDDVGGTTAWPTDVDDSQPVTVRVLFYAVSGAVTLDQTLSVWSTDDGGTEDVDTTAGLNLAQDLALTAPAMTNGGQLRSVSFTFPAANVTQANTDGDTWMVYALNRNAAQVGNSAVLGVHLEYTRLTV